MAESWAQMFNRHNKELGEMLSNHYVAFQKLKAKHEQLLASEKSITPELRGSLIKEKNELHKRVSQENKNLVAKHYDEAKAFIEKEDIHRQIKEVISESKEIAQELDKELRDKEEKENKKSAELIKKIDAEIASEIESEKNKSLQNKLLDKLKSNKEKDRSRSQGLG